MSDPETSGQPERPSAPLSVQRSFLFEAIKDVEGVIGREIERTSLLILAQSVIVTGIVLATKFAHHEADWFRQTLVGLGLVIGVAAMSSTLLALRSVVPPHRHHLAKMRRALGSDGPNARWKSRFFFVPIRVRLTWLGTPRTTALLTAAVHATDEPEIAERIVEHYAEELRGNPATRSPGLDEAGIVDVLIAELHELHALRAWKGALIAHSYRLFALEAAAVAAYFGVLGVTKGLGI